MNPHLFYRLHCSPHRWQGQLQQATLNGKAATVHLADGNVTRREAEQTERATASKTLCSPSWDCISMPNVMTTIPLLCTLTGHGRKVIVQVSFRQLFSYNKSKSSLLLFMSTVPPSQSSAFNATTACSIPWPLEMAKAWRTTACVRPRGHC